VREQIFATAVRRDEAKALSVIEPLDGTGFHITFLKMNEQRGAENQGRGMGPTGVPLMGELRKTYSHSPLEILPELYTAYCLAGQLAPRETP
jgi:hypothetical protein